MARRARTAVATPQTSEQQSSVHEEMFKTLLQTPHGNNDQTLAIHVEQFQRDPNFYGRLAVWAVALHNNVVRDINDIFMAVLFNSPYPEHKEAAYAMLNGFPPYQVVRIGQLFTGYSETLLHAAKQLKSSRIDALKVQ